jgi:hypothetical protein
MRSSLSPTAPILILALPDDPIAAAVRQVATRHDLRIWQPADLAEVGWSVTLDHDRDHTAIRLIDRRDRQSWESGELAGIWYQALPPMASLEGLAERDRHYARAEIRSSLAAIWRFAASPVFGQPRAEEVNALLGPGPEARIAMLRFGLPAATMIAGTARIERLARAGHDIRISSLGSGESWWWRHDQADSRITPDHVTAIASDGRTVRLIVVAYPEVRAFEISERGNVASVAPSHEDTRLATRIRRVTGLDLAVAFCSRQCDTWRITRLSAQIPWWLTEVEDFDTWLAAWLIARCAQGTPDLNAAGGSR